jgi:uncharacterized protein (UPF0297 family)
VGQSDDQMRLRRIYDALQEKGYHPIGQLVGYILTEDPTYITNHNGARQLIRKIDRDDLLREIVENYFISKLT